MLRRKKTKIAALLLSLAMIILLFTDISPYDVGIYKERGTLPFRVLSLTPSNSFYSINSFTYHFFHANALHIFLNLWCFLSCVFLADMSAGKLFAAYLIACTAPAVSPMPTVGFSGVCFALLGLIMWQSGNKLEYNACVLLGIVLPFVIVPHAVNNLLHLYCYAVAVMAAHPRPLRGGEKGASR